MTGLFSSARSSPLRILTLVSIAVFAWNVSSSKFLEYYTALYPGQPPGHSVAAATDRSLYLDRQCVASGSLENRKRVRWVGFVLEQGLYSTSYRVGGYYLEKGSFLGLHIAAFLLTALFSLQTGLLLLGGGDRASETGDLTFFAGGLAFAALTLHILGGQTQEFTFSAIEAACIAATLFFAIRRNAMAFTGVAIIASLNRESGFLIIGIWVLFNGLRSALLPAAAAIAAFLLANHDLIACMTRPGFFLSSSHVNGQETWIDAFREPLSGMVALALNFGFFALLALAARRAIQARASADLRRAVDRLCVAMGVYLIVFAVAAPPHHMSIRFLLVPFLTVLATLFFGLRLQSQLAST